MRSHAQDLTDHRIIKLIRRFSSQRHRGFALVAVVWSLGLLALLATTIIVGAKYRNRAVLDYTSVATAAAAAESAINLAIATLESGPSNTTANFPLRCQMPSGEQATVVIEPEAGKVDLNTASPSVLVAFFTSLTADERLASRISADILSKRKADLGAQPGNASVKDKARSAQAGFGTVMELDQIEGVSAMLFRNALPFVTISSGRTEPDPELAPERLRSWLHLKQAQSAQGAKPVAGATVTIRADIRSPNGARFIREALVSLISENDRPFAIREWRRGDIRQVWELPPAPNHGYRSCLLLGRAPQGHSSS